MGLGLEGLGLRGVEGLRASEGRRREPGGGNWRMFETIWGRLWTLREEVLEHHLHASNVNGVEGWTAFDGMGGTGARDTRVPGESKLMTGTRSR